MRLAFYAPMKPPDHPVPSGDRIIAQSLMTVLGHMGAEATLASRLRSRDGSGDPALQRQIMAEADTEVRRLTADGRQAQWQAWVTYHSYYKAPDLIGPSVSRALDIPYLQIEATRASKRLTGPWQLFAQAAEAATDAAKVVFHFTARDATALQASQPAGQTLIHLHPFLPRSDLPEAGPLKGPMLSVGMMRAGDKLASYRIIAETLALLQTSDWRLDIAGDGPVQAEVAALMAPFGPRVRMLGQLEPEALHRAYRGASLLFWPGVNEALGMVYLEAQAAGLPVVAQDRPGMREVLAPGVYPAVNEGPAALARRLDSLQQEGDLRRRAGDAARQHILKQHLLPAAAATLRRGFAAAGLST